MQSLVRPPISHWLRLASNYQKANPIDNSLCRLLSDPAEYLLAWPTSWWQHHFCVCRDKEPVWQAQPCRFHHKPFGFFLLDEPKASSLEASSLPSPVSAIAAVAAMNAQVSLLVRLFSSSLQTCKPSPTTSRTLLGSLRQRRRQPCHAPKPPSQLPASPIYKLLDKSPHLAINSSLSNVFANIT